MKIIPPLTASVIEPLYEEWVELKECCKVHGSGSSLEQCHWNQSATVNALDSVMFSLADMTEQMSKR